MEGLNLMIAKFAKSADFGMKTANFEKLWISKNHTICKIHENCKILKIHENHKICDKSVDFYVKWKTTCLRM